MQVLTLYHLNGRLLGQSSFDCDILPHSLAYFCPTCGEVWGRIICTAESQPPHWDSLHCPCLLHQPSGVPDWSRIPGTLTDPFLTNTQLSKMWWGRSLDHLPPPVLRYEFLTLLSHYERFSQ